MGITIVDAPCGAGKTNWAIQMMKEEESTAFIYCTPFLDEITRVRGACGRERFKEPSYESGTSKIEDFNALLASGTDIATTHSTFINATPETLELIKQGEYTLVIDEALDTVVEFNKIPSVEKSPKQSINYDDIKMLLDRGLIQVGEDCRISWTGGSYGESKFSELENLARLGRLYLARDKLIVCVFPPEMFRHFNNVYVLTYLFSGSIMKSYLELFGLDYGVMSVSRDDIGYSLRPYDELLEREFRQKIKGLINLCTVPRLISGYKNNALTKTWYSTNIRNEDAIKRLKGDLVYYFSRVAKAKAGNKDILWTCPTDYQTKIQGKGYTCVRQLTKTELALNQTAREQLEKELACFLPLNARASNLYKERWALAYCHNMRANPMIVGFFEDNGSPIDENLLAISCLIQWIFRSRIRDGKEIILYLPSPRMRKLLQDWLDFKL